jgi:hypothetical protein
MLIHMSHKAYSILILHFYWFRSIIYKSWISRIASVEGDRDVSKQDATSNTFGYGWDTGCIHGVTEEQGCSECTAWFYTDVKDRATILKHTHVSHKVRKFMMNFFSNLFFLFIIFSLSSELSAFLLLIHLRNNQKVSMHLNCFVQHGIRKVFPVQLPW